MMNSDPHRLQRRAALRRGALIGPAYGEGGTSTVESQQVVYEGGELREDPPLATVTASTSRKQF
jgi:hypothetical protein